MRQPYSSRFEGGKFIGTMDQWPGGAANFITVDWEFEPAPFQRFITVSMWAGATAAGALTVAGAVPVPPSTEPDSNDNSGYRWISLGTVFNGQTPNDPATEGLWSSAIIQIPPHVKGIRLSSSYTWANVADRPRGITITALHFTVQTLPINSLNEA